MKNMLVIFIGTALLLGCGSEPENTTEQKTETEAEQHHSHETKSLQLNDGEKWKVNESMMVYMVKMKEDVSGFEGTTLDDYTLLGLGLKENIDNVTSNCTMEGRAHDELHKWLIPYIGLVNELPESDDLSAAQTKLNEIKHSLEVFDTYFK